MLPDSVVDTGVVRFYVSDSISDSPKNGMRECIKDWKLCGVPFRKELGKLPFSTVIKQQREKDYLTIGGPQFYSTGHTVYGNTVHNLGHAFNRIDAARKNEQTLAMNNRAVGPYKGRGISRALDSYFKQVKRNLAWYTSRIGDNLEEWHRLANDVFHPKYQLRKRSYEKLLRYHDMYCGMFMKGITCKLKIPEFAKMGKDGRIIGDYSCPGSLLGAFIVNPLKVAFSLPVETSSTIIRFCYSTGAQEIDDMFTEMKNSNKNYYIYFSDDMVCKLHVNGVPHYYNLDISSCDKSNTPAVFDRLAWFFDYHPQFKDIIDRSIAQCKMPVRIQNPESTRSHPVGEWITARPLYAMEFSGTILTTLLNNIASSSICVSIDYHSRNLTQYDPLELVPKSAERVGYIVTLDPAEHYEDLQFLKLSFWEDDDGRLNSFLNLGCLLRSFGSTWGDYPFDSTKGETVNDGIQFRNWVVLKGFQHSGLSAVYNELVAAPASQRPLKYDERKNRKEYERYYTYRLLRDNSSIRKCVPDESLALRYRISMQQLAKLQNTAKAARVGQRVTSREIDLIFTKDYGYKSPLG